MQMAGFQVLGNTLPLLQTCTALALPADCTEGFCPSILVIFESFLVF